MIGLDISDLEWARVQRRRVPRKCGEETQSALPYGGVSNLYERVILRCVLACFPRSKGVHVGPAWRLLALGAGSCPVRLLDRRPRLSVPHVLASRLQAGRRSGFQYIALTSLSGSRNSLQDGALHTSRASLKTIVTLVICYGKNATNHPSSETQRLCRRYGMTLATENAPLTLHEASACSRTQSICRLHI